MNHLELHEEGIHHNRVYSPGIKDGKSTNAVHYVNRIEGENS